MDGKELFAVLLKNCEPCVCNLCKYKNVQSCLVS